MNEVEIPLKITGIGAIKAELRELKGAIADATDPEQVAQLSARAGELKDQLKDANDAVNVFASGSKFEQVSNSIGGIKDSLMSLDFEEAQQKAQVFSNVMGKLNPGDLAKGFKGFMGTLSTVGGAFVKLGMTILANPIFLLVAVITAIVVAIGVFLKKIGVLDAIFKALMIPIDAVIQGFKDLTDWMGLTDNAAEENAEVVKETSKIKEDALKQEMAARRSLLSLTQDLTEEEKQQIEEQLGIAIERNQTQEDLAIEESERQMAINDERIASLNAKKELTDEEKKELEGLYKHQVDLNNAIIQNEVAKVNKKRELLLSVDKQIELLNAKQIKNEADRSKAMLDIQEREAIATIEKEKNKAKAYGATPAELAKFDQLILLTQKDFQRQRLEITNKANAGAAKATTTSVANTNKEVESAQSKHLKKMREQNEIALRDAETQGKSEQEIRDLRIKQLEAEREYIIANKKKIYKAEIDQANAISKIDNDLKKARDKNLEEQEKADNEALIARLKRKEVNAKDDIAKFEAQKELLAAEAKIKIDSLEVGSDERLLLEDETAQKLKSIDDQITAKQIENQQKILASAQLRAETELSQAQFTAEREAETADQKILAAEDIYNKQLAAFLKQQEAEEAATDLSEAQKEAIKVKYDQARILAEEEKAKKINEIEAAQIAQGLEYATMGVQATQQLTELFFAFRKRKLKEGTAEAEKAAKQEFLIQKGFNLGMAVIDGAKAITSILAQYPKFDGGFAMAAALASAGIASAVNIGKIASAQFTGGGGAPTAPDIPTGGFEQPSTTGGMATPNVSLFGQGNQLNNVGGEGAQQQGQTITVNAIVSETEMTNVQNKVNKIQKNAEL
jgi:hypothetical protein